MTKQLADAVRLLELMLGSCDSGASEHSWRKCKRCSAIALLQDSDALTTRLLRAIVEELKSR